MEIKGNVFWLAKQLVSRNRDVMGTSCVKVDEGITYNTSATSWSPQFDFLSSISCNGYQDYSLTFMRCHLQPS